MRPAKNENFVSQQIAINYINVTGLSKTGLISGVRNCSYSAFSSAKSSFVDFLFSSKIQNMTLLLYLHTIIIPGEPQLKLLFSEVLEKMFGLVK